jgi:hypothetical protein
LFEIRSCCATPAGLKLLGSGKFEPSSCLNLLLAVTISVCHRVWLGLFKKALIIKQRKQINNLCPGTDGFRKQKQKTSHGRELTIPANKTKSRHMSIV